MKAKPTRKPFSDPFDDLSDEAFEREVLSLLACTAKASHLFENPVFVKPTALSAGAWLGPYEIVAGTRA